MMDSYFDGYLTKSFTDNCNFNQSDTMTDEELDAYYDHYIKNNPQFDGSKEFIDDQVNSPQHYTHNGIEAIDVIEAKLTNDQYQGYLQGSVMKYLLRSNYKGKREEDLKKAQWYLNHLIDTV